MKLNFDYWRRLAICTISFMMFLFFCRCTTVKYIPQVEYHDRYIAKTDSFMQTDSVFLYDSVSVFLKGDTVFKEKYRLLFKDRYISNNKVDTILVRDSVPYTVKIEKSLSKTDKTFLNIGKIISVVSFIGFLALLGWVCYKTKLYKYF